MYTKTIVQSMKCMRVVSRSGGLSGTEIAPKHPESHEDQDLYDDHGDISERHRWIGWLAFWISHHFLIRVGAPPPRAAVASPRILIRTFCCLVSIRRGA